MAKKIGESNKRFLTIKFHENLKKQEEYIRKERNHISFTRESGNAIKQLVKSLRSGNMEVKRFREFLHAKAYIFSNIPSSSSSSSNAVIAGSSNLTGSGLASNLELNLGRFN